MASVGRYFASMLIPKLVKRGLSSAAIIRNLKVKGFTYRRATMLSDIRRNIDTFNFSDKVIKVGDFAEIPKNVMVETELRGARRYRVYGRAKTISKETGRVTYEHISMYDDSLRSKTGYESTYIKAKEEAKYREEVYIDSIEILSIEHNKGWEY